VKIQQLYEQLSYEVIKISKSDNEGLQSFSNFYNDSGQLSWQLNAQRLKSKLGSKGVAYGLYYDGELVGTIGLKQMDVGGLNGAEIGYLMVSKDHRSLPNVMMMYKEILTAAKRFDVVFVTTNILNRPINVLLQRTNKIEQILKIKSPFSANKLFVWSSKISNHKYSPEERMAAIRTHFEDNILDDME
jgi:hypothetical protein